MGKTTIQDVARLAGVSIKTVSRVTNKEANVRAETRARVIEAIETLDYRPNPSARSLAGTRSYLIGLLYDNPSASYLVNIQNGALRTCRNEGYDLVIHPCDYRDPKLIGQVTSMVRSASVDGLILTPPLSDIKKLTDALAEQEVTFVCIAPATSTTPSRAVLTNDREACAEMTRFLASLGHRNIAFVIGHPDHGAVGTRFLGYRDGLKQSSLKFDESIVEQGYNSFESGESCARRLLEREKRPTAIFASNDDMAAGVMKVAHEMGISIPSELSVAGFDDIPLAGQIWPALTTIRQPIEAMAERAAGMVLRQLKGIDDADTERSIESTLVVRQSTGPAP